MQSAILMALRTMVLLLSLLTVPLAAVYGTGSWPQVQAFFDQCRVRLADKLDPHRTEEDHHHDSDLTTTPLEPLVNASPQAGTPDVLTAPPLATLSPPSPAAKEIPKAEESSPAGIVAPAEMPAAAAEPGAALPKPPFWDPGVAGVAPPPQNPAIPATLAGPQQLDAQTQPASYVAEAPDPLPTQPAGALPLPESQAAPDRMGWIQHRLQTLGAAWYRLEATGTNGESFRFQCKMTSLSNPNYVRYFEATSGEPLRAMQHVLDQVDTWMASRDTGRR